MDQNYYCKNDENGVQGYNNFIYPKDTFTVNPLGTGRWLMTNSIQLFVNDSHCTIKKDGLSYCHSLIVRLSAESVSIEVMLNLCRLYRYTYRTGSMCLSLVSFPDGCRSFVYPIVCANFRVNTASMEIQEAIVIKKIRERCKRNDEGDQMSLEK